MLTAIGMRLLTGRVPGRLVRINVNKVSVPAVLGIPIVAAGLVCLAAVIWIDGSTVAWAAGVVTVTLGVAGFWDDLRGHELPRGFSGHLTAARGGRLTGGIVKLLAGAAGGLIAGLFVAEGRAVIEVALLVALSANLINLFDRAPGRAGKVALVIGIPLIVFGASDWGVIAAGFLGALTVSLPADLAERAMLGDAGANPLGGLLGLGLGVSLPPAGRWGAIVVLLVLNVMSERISFSQVISNNAFLSRLDLLGRRGEEREAS